MTEQCDLNEGTGGEGGSGTDPIEQFIGQYGPSLQKVSKNLNCIVLRKFT